MLLGDSPSDVLAGPSGATLRLRATQLLVEGEFLGTQRKGKQAESKKRPGVVPRGNLSATPGWPGRNHHPEPLRCRG
jgi:hypothetical protein